MTYRGKVRGGVVVLKGSVTLPEGAEVDVMVTSPTDENNESSSDSNIWDQLATLGRAAESAPTSLSSDLAENHDHYLHGLPKRK